MDALAMYQERVKRVLPYMTLSPYLQSRFLEAHDVYEFNHIPLMRRDGTMDEYPGILSLWWGPWVHKRGGMRFDPFVTRNEVIALSALMAIKCGLLRLPYSGAKFGSPIDPQHYTREEIESFAKNVIARIKFVLGRQYFAAPDMNTGNLIGIMLKHFQDINPHPDISPYKVFSGKPEAILGLRSRTEATGVGAIIMTEYMLSQDVCPGIKNLSKKINVIQGFGQVARPYFKYAELHGATVKAISDVSCGFYNRGGLSYEEVMREMENKKIFAELKDGSIGDRITNEELLDLECDILVLAARENQMTTERAKRNRAKLHVEIANNPTDFEAEPILKEKGIVTLADVAVNAGGVQVSADEVEAGDYWGDEERIRKNLEMALRTAAKKIVDAMRTHSLDMRDASFLAALQQTAEQAKQFGLAAFES